MSFLRFMCGAGIYQLVKIKLWLLWRGKKMLEFNQSHHGGGGDSGSSGGGFDSPGPSLVETVQVVIRSAKWNYNPENSCAQSQPRRQSEKRRRTKEEGGGHVNILSPLT